MTNAPESTPTFPPTFTHSDAELLESALALLAQAGVGLNHDIEPEDIEDAVFDVLPPFRARPLMTLAALEDPDGSPMLARTFAAGPIETLEQVHGAVKDACEAAGSALRDVVVFPDATESSSGASSGSVRVRVDQWKVTDVGYDFSRGADRRLAGSLASAAAPAGREALVVRPGSQQTIALFLDPSPATRELSRTLAREASV